MEKDIIDLDCIQIIDEVENWEKAIEMSSSPLLEKGYINKNYVEGMKQTVRNLGAYIVLVPGFAMPHARGDLGVFKNSCSILKLNKPVYFDNTEESMAKIIMPIACVDNSNHMKMIQILANVLEDSDTLTKLLNSQNKEEIFNIFKQKNL